MPRQISSIHLLEPAFLTGNIRINVTAFVNADIAYPAAAARSAFIRSVIINVIGYKYGTACAIGIGFFNFDYSAPKIEYAIIIVNKNALIYGKEVIFAGLRRERGDIPALCNAVV